MSNTQIDFAVLASELRKKSPVFRGTLVVNQHSFRGIGLRRLRLDVQLELQGNGFKVPVAATLQQQDIPPAWKLPGLPCESLFNQKLFYRKLFAAFDSLLSLVQCDISFPDQNDLGAALEQDPHAVSAGSGADLARAEVYLVVAAPTLSLWSITSNLALSRFFDELTLQAAYERSKPAQGIQFREFF